MRAGTAVSLGAPVAEPGRESAALEELTTYCERNGWTPALLAADSAQNDRAVAAGYASLRIGVEAVIDVAEFSTAGKRRSNVRHSVSRARREEVTVLPHVGHERTDRRTTQLGEVSAAWLASKGGPKLSPWGASTRTGWTTRRSTSPSTRSAPSRSRWSPSSPGCPSPTGTRWCWT